MIALESLVDNQSAVVPGLIFWTRKMTEGRRIELRAKMRDASTRMNELMTELRATPETIAVVQVDGAGPAEKPNPAYPPILNKLIEHRVDVIEPLWVNWGLDKVTDAEGLPVTMDGKDLTRENFVALAPPELYAEVNDAIQASAGLTDKQKKTSSLPIISNDPEAGKTTGTTAPAAELPVPMNSETADDISPSGSD